MIELEDEYQKKLAQGMKREQLGFVVLEGIVFYLNCANEFLFCGYAGKLLVPITASLLLPPSNLNVKGFYGTKHLIFCSGDML